MYKFCYKNILVTYKENILRHRTSCPQLFILPLCLRINVPCFLFHCHLHNSLLFLVKYILYLLQSLTEVPSLFLKLFPKPQSCAIALMVNGNGYWPLWASQVVLVVKNQPANAEDVRDTGSIPGWGRSPGGGNGSPLQNSCLENPIDRGSWWATVHQSQRVRQD